MRLLHYAGPADDADHVLVETPDGERFQLVVDAPLRAGLKADQTRLREMRTEQHVSPREIQTRVRAGESAQDIADEADLPIERVLRFAAAVLEERDRISDEARRARARRTGTDGPLVVFGETVDARFAAHGIDPTTVGWDSYRREDGQWIVLARWVGGQADRVANWAFSLSSRSVTPLDDTAADLLSDRPIRPFPTQAPPALVSVSDDVTADAVTGPLPTPEQVFDQEAVAPLATASLFAEPQFNGLVSDAAPLALRLADALPAGSEPGTGAARRAHPESDEDRAARARIPSWDDILLGVRRKGH